MVEEVDGSGAEVCVVWFTTLGTWELARLALRALLRLGMSLGTCWIDI